MTEHSPLDPKAAWRDRYRVASMAWGAVANLNPSRGLVCTNRDGIYQLYAWDVHSGELRQLTDAKTGVVNGTLSADGESVYYMRDDGGNEIGHFVRVPFSGGAPEDVTPDLPPYGGFTIHQSFDGGTFGMKVADPTGQMLYTFAPGQAPKLIHKSRKMFVGPSISQAGEMAVIATTEGTGTPDRQLFAFDLVTGKRIAELWDGAGTSHDAVAFSPIPGDDRLLATTNASGYARPLLWNPKTGERRDLFVDELQGEVSAVGWSRDAKQVLLSQLHLARQRLYVYDLDGDGLTRLDHPEGVLHGHFDTCPFLDDGRVVVTWQDPSHPSRVVAMERDTGSPMTTLIAAGAAPEGKPWRSISFESENGDTIQGWLVVPDGEGPFPTILHTHGGPSAVMTAVYAPESQTWVDCGFAFLTINYHGSTTFGRTFERSIDQRLGDLETEDMASAYRWLVDEGIARPDAVFLTGGSYGGYLTLLGVGRRPELWAGGMAVVAIADWMVMYEDESEMLRGYQRALFGGSPEETPDRHKKSSPITYAADVQAPVFVIQGSNDTRCPARQMKEYEARLRSLGKEIDVHWFDAGHGSRAQEQQIDQQERKLRFALGILDR